MGPTFAVLPVKRFEHAKQRLSGTFSPERHLQLIEAMIGDVLAALNATEGLDGTVMVTAEPRAAALAEAAGVEVLPEPSDDGHSAAAVVGMAYVAKEHAAVRALCVPGDCPALDPDELATLLEDDRPAPRVILVSDRYHLGTNALLMSPPGVIEPAFGTASRYRHEVRSREAGARYSARAVRSLELDVDTRRDLGALRRWLEERPGVAVRTRALLLSGDWTEAEEAAAGDEVPDASAASPAATAETSTAANATSPAELAGRTTTNAAPADDDAPTAEPAGRTTTNAASADDDDALTAESA